MKTVSDSPDFGAELDKDAPHNVVGSLALASGALPQNEPPGGARFVRRFGFRLLAVYLAFYILACLGNLGMGSWISAVTKFWQVVVPWVGRVIMGLNHPISYVQNGSGDQTFHWIQQWCFLALAFVIAFLWVWFDRRRRYDGLIHEVLRILVRYELAFTMMIYGVGKMNQGQFPAPGADRLVQPYGDSSPMGLLWTFMGYSSAYCLFTGLVESIGGILLLFRRTTTLGALVVTAAMTNVVMLNFCFDVPVKLFSTNLLLFAVFLLAPDLRRLANAFVLNRPTGAVPLVLRWPAPWMARTAAVLKVLVVGALLATTVGMSVQMMRFRNQTSTPDLTGGYAVESFSSDGRIFPPLLNDAARWRTVSFRPFGVLVRTMNSSTVRRFRATNHPTTKTLVLVTTDSDPKSFVMTYSRSSPDRLRMEGQIDGHALIVDLRRIDEHQFLLVNRGFHWINEVPFNR
jgi:hypothetical protein